MKQLTLSILIFISTLILFSVVTTGAFGKKPPWAGGPGGPGDEPPPVSAPEPLTITLIGMGASAAAGYYLGKKKKS